MSVCPFVSLRGMEGLGGSEGQREHFRGLQGASRSLRRSPGASEVLQTIVPFRAAGLLQITEK